MVQQLEKYCEKDCHAWNPIFHSEKDIGSQINRGSGTGLQQATSDVVTQCSRQIIGLVVQLVRCHSYMELVLRRSVVQFLQSTSFLFML
jgi:hypothetical protein